MANDLTSRCRCGHQFCYVCGTPWRNCHCPHFQERRLYQRAAEVAGRPRQRPLQAPAAIPIEELDPAEQQRRLREFQQQAPAHVIQAAPRGRVNRQGQGPARGQRHVQDRHHHRKRNPNAVQYAERLVTDLRHTQAAHHRARENAADARARRFNAGDGLRAADIDDIAAHLRDNHECRHERRWRRFHHGANRCEICQRVRPNPKVGECPTCFLQACYDCRKQRMRAGE